MIRSTYFRNLQTSAKTTIHQHLQHNIGTAKGEYKHKILEIGIKGQTIFQTKIGRKVRNFTVRKTPIIV